MEHEAPAIIEYESPNVVDYGDLVELTAAQHHGGFTDADFHAGTPTHHPTFSN